MCKNLSLLVCGALIAVACGGGKTATGPSELAGVTATPAAVVSGRVAEGSVTSVSIAGTGASSVRGLSPTGSSLSAPVDAGGRFTLGVPAGNIQLQFAGPGVDARLGLAGVQMAEDIKITVRVNGSVAELDDNRRTRSDNHVEVEGRVTMVNVPGRTLTVGDTVVSVPGGTPITNNSGVPVELSTIAAGDRVEAKGTLTGGTVTATQVRLENEKTGTSGGAATGATIEISGAISSRRGTCPSITFNVGTTVVSTNERTQFEDGTCARALDNVMVEVKGTRQANGSLLASSIELKGPDDNDDDENDDDKNEVELRGTLAARSGSCPVLTLTVGSASIETSSRTEFKNVTCSALAVKDSVEIEATRQANGKLLAKKVEKKR